MTYDITTEIAHRLFVTLEEKGVEINNEKGASNAIIIALALAFGKGEEIGEQRGAKQALKRFVEHMQREIEVLDGEEQ